MCGLDSPARLLKLLMAHLIRYDYQHAWFVMTAVTDFLKGPDLLDEGLPAIQARVTRESAELAPIRLPAALGLSPAPAEYPGTRRALQRRMLVSFARVLTGRLRHGALGVQYTDVPLQWVRLARSYVLTNREGHFFLRFSYSKRLTWSLLRRTTAAILSYRRRRHEAAAAWKEAFPRLVSEENWRDMLDLHEARHDVAEAS